MNLSLTCITTNTVQNTTISEVILMGKPLFVIIVMMITIETIGMISRKQMKNGDTVRIMITGTAMAMLTDTETRTGINRLSVHSNDLNQARTRLLA